jgi:hypothetical protein
MFAVPAYVTVIRSVPTGREVVVKLAFPPDNVPVPNTVVPSVKVTVPVGMVVGEVTVAVSFTDCPDVEGFREDVRVVVVTAWLTTWLSPPELVADSVSPLYVAVIASVPAGKLLFVSIATPLVFNETEPRVVVPFAKTTFPVGVIGAAA